MTLFDGIAYPVSIEERLIPHVFLASWLFSQPLYPKVYLKEKGSRGARAAVGSSLLFDHPPLIKSSQEIRLYGGQRFSPFGKGKEGLWGSFPDCAYWLPERELSVEGDRATLRHYVKKPLLPCPNSFVHQVLPRSFQTSYTPIYNLWDQGVEKALHLIQKKEIHKVVLARKTSLFFDTAPCPFTKLFQLEQENRSGTLFFFQFEPSSAFLGVSPENLYSRDRSHLSIEAIAGTRKDSNSFSPKEMKEFTLVKDAVKRLLTPYSTSQKWQEKDGVIQAGNLYHLYNKLTSILDPCPSDCKLLKLLHPTPALGGTPKKKASLLIDELENFDRGWYGAPIGILSQEKSFFSVAIRSALFHHNQVDLFTGAGIVEGSSAQAEWEELDAKLSWFF